ncbi:cupin domain-containing protein [Chitinimonas taiwanensis]|jgi:transcriptional regulator with XRE-family HTH domain|uniref:Transcriptional regulator, XRE family with cupin sensor n=1 Tax=Chitinimonas taiwanensis DSM 18899 TaxID=1121279 RepID=A0A1K2HIP3_9NEIS|nr:cupin domain-containing protein [Chitinimonas taiwanensis]SFZ76720.1 transcriptional regulator, XRE family with cupin sensor [Chitinimonas taiwanensis DSM 18899]
MSLEVSTRLKLVREKHALSQRELAKRAGVTNSTISLIEQNRVSPSISSLKKVLDGVPMSLAEFFTFDIEEPARPSPFFEREQMPDIGGEGVQLFLVGHGVQNRHITMLREIYEAGADTGAEMLSHAGQEVGMVVRGEIELTVAEQSRVLKPGEGYYFDSTLPHRFRNLSQQEAEIVSASLVSPNAAPSF